MQLREIHQDLTAGKTLKAYAADKIAKIAIGDCTIGDQSTSVSAPYSPVKTTGCPFIFHTGMKRQKKFHCWLISCQRWTLLLMSHSALNIWTPSSLCGRNLPTFPASCPLRTIRVRRVCSIVYTAAVVPIEKEGMRLAALAPHTEYLKAYIDFVKDAPPADGEVKVKEIKRKIAAVKTALQTYIQKEYGASLMRTCSKSFSKD